MKPLKQFAVKHKLAVSLVGVVTMACVLVSISMVVYYKTGAYQLDLSRPEYKELRSQIDNDTKETNAFEPQGPITQDVLDDFLDKYKEKANRLLDTKAFSSDVLSDQQLGLTEEAIEE